MIRPDSSIKTLLTEIQTASSMTALCEAALSAARVYAGADGATLVLRDGDQCHYYDERAISPLWKGSRFAMNICVSGEVMRSGRAICIPEISLDPRIPFSLYQPTFVKSLCLVPIGAPTAIAALGAYWQHKHEVTEDQLLVLNRLARSVARAMSPQALSIAT